MGEVYRADDLKLGQPVALNFLRPSLAQDAAYLERFHAEVRNARQVSHPNVCRVYDIAEADGQHFPKTWPPCSSASGGCRPDKALQVARQDVAALCVACVARPVI